MDSATKSFELQAQVRQNAECTKNAFNDLYNWEKEIKDKEKELLQEQQTEEDLNKSSLPIRSHIKEQESDKQSLENVAPKENVTNGLAKAETETSPSAEKHDTPYDPLELQRKQANEFKERGNQYVKLGLLQLAADEYTKAIELNPNEPIFYSNRALCYLKMERYEECIEDCNCAIEIDNLAIKAYYRRMMANESLGNNTDALKDCTTILMIDPTNIEAKRSRERINERLSKSIKTQSSPKFSPLLANMVDILPIDKPAHERSTKPLRRVTVSDAFGAKYDNLHEHLKISDDDIDKLFNSNCGHFEEITNSTDRNIKKRREIAKYMSEEIKKVNSVKAERMNAILGNTIDKERPLPPAPTSTAQFYSSWKELTMEQKYRYLKSTPRNRLAKILGAGFDADTLADILNTLQIFYIKYRDPAAEAILLEVSRNQQVSILSLFMSEVDRAAVMNILQFIKAKDNYNTALVEEIAKNFNVKLI